jgi:hypothetical protein
MCVQSGFAFKNILFLLLTVVLAVWAVLWIYSLGISIDQKNGSVKLTLGLSSNHIHERALEHIASLGVEKESNVGMSFIIYYRNGHSEKLFYRFYRVSFIEAGQFKRIKRELTNIQF